MKFQMKRILSLTIALCLLVSCCAVLGACEFGMLKFEKMTVDLSTVKTEYTVGDEVDFSDLKVSVRYSDTAQNARVGIDKLKFELDGAEVTDLNTLTATAGEKVLTVKYYDDVATNAWQTATLTITVSEKIVPAFVSMALKEDSVKTVYCVGDEVDFSGIQVEVRYENADADLVLVGYDRLTLDYAEDLTETTGAKTITVKYNDTLVDHEEKTLTFTVTVGNPTFKSFTALDGSYNTVVGVGETYDLSELRFALTYEEGPAYGKTLRASDVMLTFGEGEPIADLTNAEGEKTVTASYTDMYGNDCTATFTVTVELRFLSMTVVADSVETTYYQGDEWNFDGIQVEVKYNNTAYNLTLGKDDVTLSGTDDLTATIGEKTITVTYADPKFENTLRTATFKVTVAAPGFKGVVANTEGVKLSYRMLLDTLDLSGLTFAVDYEDDDKDETFSYTDARVTFTPDDDLLQTAGEKTLSFRFEDEFGTIKTVEITITVTAPAYDAENTALNLNDAKVNYYTTDDLGDFSGVTVDVHYSDSDYDVTLSGEDLTIDTSKVNTAKAGTYEVDVRFIDPVLGGLAKTLTFHVTYTNPTFVSKTVRNLPDICKLGDMVDFSSVNVDLVYDPAEYNKLLVASELSITGLDTSKTGSQSVVVGYTDPYTGNSASIVVTVVVAGGKFENFDTPAAYTAYQMSVTKAGTAKYGEEGFEGQFFSEQDTNFYVGDDNEFRFRPLYSLVDNDDNEIENKVVILDTLIGGLDRQAVSSTKVEYRSGDTLIVTADTMKGTYQFTPAAVGNSYTLAIRPSTSLYTYTGSAVAITVKVVDGYNVYTAKDLCVMDNDGTHNHGKPANGADQNWAHFKDTYRYTGIDTNAIVLQNDIYLTIDDVPETYFVTSISDITLSNGAVIEAGSKFLYDGIDLYIRKVTPKNGFAIYGNYFTLDTGTSFPTVPSTGMKDDFKKDAFDPDVTYGDDYSNSVLIRFNNTDDSKNAANVTISNLNVSGNANKNEVTDKDNFPVSAGGLIFIKSSATVTTFTNSIIKRFFIAIFPDSIVNTNVDATINFNYSKCFDSYQNAAFVWGNATLNVDHSYMQRAGGPLVILQHVEPADHPDSRIPTMTANESVLESFVNGGELWFSAVGATTTAGLIKLLSTGLLNNGFGTYVNAEGKMNIIALIMSNGTDAPSTMNSIETQGRITITNNDKTTVCDRKIGDLAKTYGTTLGGTIYGIQKGDEETGKRNIPFFNVGADLSSLLICSADITKDPPVLNGLFTPTFASVDANDDYKAYYGNMYTNSDYVSLNYGGFGLMFSLSH